MSCKFLCVVLLSLSLGGCVAYGGGGYGHRGYERHYSTTYYQVQRHPVYVVQYPRHKEIRYYDKRHGYHHDGRRHDDGRHSQHRYAPVPLQSQQRAPSPHKPRYQARAEQPRSGWNAQHQQQRTDRDGRHSQPRSEQYQDERQRGDGWRDGERRRWQGQQQ